MQIREGAFERVGECHWGALKVIAESVYLCHCKACQRRTGTAFHFGVTYRRARVRLQGEYKIYERAADSGSRIRFYFVLFLPGGRCCADTIAGPCSRAGENRCTAWREVH
jgi:Glutathione-dependent formaldehyde-activating enzyme